MKNRSLLSVISAISGAVFLVTLFPALGAQAADVEAAVLIEPAVVSSESCSFEFDWRPVAGATKYTIGLLDKDGNTMSYQTTDTHFSWSFQKNGVLNPVSKNLPNKWYVSAWDRSGGYQFSGSAGTLSLSSNLLNRCEITELNRTTEITDATDSDAAPLQLSGASSTYNSITLQVKNGRLKEAEVYGGYCVMTSIPRSWTKTKESSAFVRQSSSDTVSIRVESLFPDTTYRCQAFVVGTDRYGMIQKDRVSRQSVLNRENGHLDVTTLSGNAITRPTPDTTISMTARGITSPMAQSPKGNYDLRKGTPFFVWQGSSNVSDGMYAKNVRYSVFVRGDNNGYSKSAEGITEMAYNDWNYWKLPDGDYSWFVRAFDADGNSKDSNKLSFSVKNNGTNNSPQANYSKNVTDDYSKLKILDYSASANSITLSLANVNLDSSKDLYGAYCFEEKEAAGKYVEGSTGLENVHLKLGFAKQPSNSDKVAVKMDDLTYNTLYRCRGFIANYSGSLTYFTNFSNYFDPKQPPERTEFSGWNYKGFTSNVLNITTWYSDNNDTDNSTKNARNEASITRAQLAKLVVNKLNPAVDLTRYTGCASDIRGQWSENFVCYLVRQNKISLLPDQSFSPNNTMNRAEGAKWVVSVLVPEKKWSDDSAYAFNDVPAGVWYAAWVNTLGNLRMSDVTPYFGKSFGPSDPLSLNAAQSWLDHLNVSNQTAQTTDNTIARTRNAPPVMSVFKVNRLSCVKAAKWIKSDTLEDQWDTKNYDPDELEPALQRCLKLKFSDSYKRLIEQYLKDFE